MKAGEKLSPRSSAWIGVKFGPMLMGALISMSYRVWEIRLEGKLCLTLLIEKSH